MFTNTLLLFTNLIFTGKLQDTNQLSLISIGQPLKTIIQKFILNSFSIAFVPFEYL